ncbi:acyl-CoA carboxylase subunit epsilon [Actinosynnema sp. NPDC051121]|nr:acyl-CoA carboxylase subunit epsilon [Saccharothrix sp.]
MSIDIQVLRGNPDDAEIAALVCALVALKRATEPDEPAPPASWVGAPAGYESAGSWTAADPWR